MTCDLHTHSVFSDGTFTPAQLIAEAERIGLSAVALTDHNSAKNCPAFFAQAKKYGIVKSTVFKRSAKENWDELRKRTANAVETLTIERTAEKAADNAVIAADIKKALLMRLKRIEAKYPLDATEVRTRKGDSTAIFRLRDLTAAYKDLTEDMPKGEGDKNAPIYELLNKLDGECDV